MTVPSIIDIVSSSKNKIVLAINKPQFIDLRFSKQYSKVNAFNLSLMAIASYSDKKSVRDLLFAFNKKESRKTSFDGVENVSSCLLTTSNTELSDIMKTYDLIDNGETDTQFFHFETSDYLLISLRGTEPKRWKDVVNDLNAALVPFPEGAGRVHKGFYKAFKSIQEDLDQIVSAASGKPVIITGHSLGGALATLVAAYVRKKYKADVMAYTFGSPLVGDSDFVNYFTNMEPITYFRVVNNEDIVTMVPPPKSNLRISLVPLAAINKAFLIPATYDPNGKPFTHLGKLVFVRKIGGSVISVDVDRKQPHYIKVSSKLVGNEDRPMMDRILDWIPFSLGDHSIGKYVSIMGTDLKLSIEAYLDSTKWSQENSKKVLEYLSTEIKELEKNKSEFEKEVLMAPYSALPDATMTPAQRSSRLTPAEKLDRTSEALNIKHLELSVQRSRLAALSAPGTSSAILKEIIDEKMTPALKRELEYQRVAIKF